MSSTIQEKIFTLVDEMGDTDATCQTTITIIDKISNNTPVYEINYKHAINKQGVLTPINDIKDIEKPCPFVYCKENVKEMYSGEIIVKNSMTQEMVKFLMMDDDELSQHTGTTTPQHYRCLIMVNILDFWD